MAHDPALETLPVLRIRSIEADAGYIEIGVHIQLIGVAVMLVVLLYPPATAHTQQQIAKEQPGKLVFPGCGKGLPVSCIVAEEAHLSEYHCQQDGIDDLEPERVNQE